MKGVVFAGNREVELRDFPDPTPGPEDVVLEMKASGICGSDLHVYRSPGGGPAAAAALGLGGEGEAVIGGHEPCGVVVARGSNVSEKAAPSGQRVMVHHYKGCGLCPSCRQGWSQLCADGFVVYGITGDGGHARYMNVPASTLVPLPEPLSFEEGAAISCGTGTAFGALRRMAPTGGSTLAVFGAGPVGLSAILLAGAMGLEVIVVDIAEERLKLAESMGAESTVNARVADPVAALKERTRGRGVDYALECSGSPEARVAAVRSTRTWGAACFVGEGQSVTLDVSPDILRRQLTLIGSWTFSTLGQDDCARFVAEHEIPLDRLISHRFQLDQAPDAYRLFDTQTTGKGVFVF